MSERERAKQLKQQIALVGEIEQELRETVVYWQTMIRLFKLEEIAQPETLDRTYRLMDRLKRMIDPDYGK